MKERDKILVKMAPTLPATMDERLSAIKQLGEDPLAQDKAAEALSQLELEHTGGPFLLEVGLVWQMLGVQSRRLDWMDRAVACFNNAAPQLPSPFLPLLATAKAYTEIGKIGGELGAFAEADRCFQAAEPLLSKTSEDQFHFFWQWANSLTLCAFLSQESTDWQRALKQYDEAAQYMAKEEPLFYQQRGECLAACGIQMNSKEMLYQAVHVFQFALPHVQNQSTLYHHLGSCYFHLFVQTYDRHWFHKAKERLEAAALDAAFQAQSHHFLGHLHLECGKLWEDEEMLEEALKHFEWLQNQNVSTQSFYAGMCETLARLGQYQERIDLLRSAKEKLARGLEIYPRDAKLLYCQGSLMVVFGHYFSDPSYFEQATVLLEEAIKDHSEHVLLWRALADAYYCTAQHAQDPHLMRKAVACYDSAIRLKQDFIPIWLDAATARKAYAEMTEDQNSAKEAAEQLERVLTALAKGEASFHDSEVRGDALARLGGVFDLLGDLTMETVYYSKAVEVLQAAITAGEDSLATRHQLALALCHVGESTGDGQSLAIAIDQFSYLTAIEDDEATYWTDWATALMTLSSLEEERKEPLLNEAEAKLRHATLLGDVQAYYYLACVASLREEFEAAIHFLQRCRKFGALPEVEDINEDGWLASLRETEIFQNFITELEG